MDCREWHSAVTAASLSGRVVDLAGAPVGKAVANAEPVADEIGQTPRSYVGGINGDWLFTLEGLPPGKYQLVVERAAISER